MTIILKAVSYIYTYYLALNFLCPFLLHLYPCSSELDGPNPINPLVKGNHRYVAHQKNLPQMKKFGSLENAYKPNVSEAYIYSENCLYVVQIISRMMKLAM